MAQGPTTQDRIAAAAWVAAGWLIGWGIFNTYDEPPGLIEDGPATALVVLFVVALGLDRIYAILKPAEGQTRFWTLGLDLASDTKAGRDMLYLGITSGIGAVVAGTVGVFLLSALGVAGVAPQFEILITGLILGGGSALMTKVIEAVTGGDEDEEEASQPRVSLH